MPTPIPHDQFVNAQVDVTKNRNFAHRFETIEIADAVAEFINASTNLGYAFPDDANPDDHEDPSCVIRLQDCGRFLA